MFYTYEVIDDTYNGDSANKGYNSLDAAISYAEMLWNHLTTREQATRNIYVIECDDPDEDNLEQHLVGRILWDSDDPADRGDQYVIRDREAGNVIDTFCTYEEARAALERYENDDRDEGIYDEDFYEIVKVK